MDVEIVAGFCAKAQILVYFAAFDQKGWIDLLDKINAVGGSERRGQNGSARWGHGASA